MMLLSKIHPIITHRWVQRSAALMTSPWALMVLIFGGAELGLSWLRPPLQPRHGLLYLLSVASSTAFWVLTSRLIGSIRSRRRSWLAAGYIGVLSATLLIATALTFQMFGQFITQDMISFIWNDPHYFVDFVVSLLVGWRLPAYLAVIAVMTFIWRPRLPAGDLPRYSGVMNIVVIVLLAVFAVGSLVTVGLMSKDYHHRIETSFLWAIPHATVDSLTQRVRLHSAQRAEVVSLSPSQQPPWSVLFIYNESVAGDSLFDTRGDLDAPGSAMPQLRDWLEAERARTVLFQRAFTNSSATNVSIPSLFTGVAPYDSVELLHEAPLPWHWARAAGLRSIMVTSQRYSWANFDSFFFSFGPDVYHTATTLDAPVVNDTGVDDMIAAKALIEELDATPLEQPVLAIYGTNAGHYPFQQDSTLLDLPEEGSRQERALLIVDSAIAQVLASLERSGRLDRTIVVMTSDHGTWEELRHVPRLFSFYDEIARIPMLVRLPQALIDQRPEWLSALEDNRGELVQNMDLVPTLVSLLGLNESAKNREILGALSGQSLLEPVPMDRTLIMLNTNDIRSWDTEGFGLFFDRDRRFVFTNVAGPQLFNVADDPEQMHDLWPQVAPETRLRILRTIESNRHLQRMFTSWAPAPP